MAGEVNIDRLSIEISANAGPAVAGVNSLTEAVRRMNREVSNSGGGLESLAETMRSLSGAFQSSTVGQLGANLQRGATGAGSLAAQMGEVWRRTNDTSSAVETLRSALGTVGTVAATTGKAFAALPVTGLKAVSGLAKGFANSIGNLFKRVSRMFTRRIIRRAITATFRAFSDGISNIYQWSKGVTGVGGNLAKSLDKIATAAMYVKNSIGAMLAPLIEAAAPIIDMISDKLAGVINKVSQFLAAITGQTTYTAAKKVATEWDKSEKSVKKSTDKIRRYVLGFDELNIAGNKDDTSDTNNGTKTPDYGSMFETLPVESSIRSLAEAVKGLFEPFKKAWDMYGDTTIKAVENALGKVKGLLADVGKTLAEVWKSPTGLDWIISTLGLFNTMVGIIGDIAEAMRTAWNDDGAGYDYISSIFGLLTNTNILLQTIGDTFRSAWNSGVGVSIMSHILSIATAINDVFSNLEASITRAWEAGGVGVSIWNGVLGIVDTVLGKVNDIVVATKDWAAALNFGPIFSAFDTLLQKIQPVVDIVGDGLAWAWKNVLLPLGKWTIEKALPAVLGTLSGAFEALYAVLTVLKEPAEWIWTNFLEPVANWTGGVIVGILNDLNSAFTGLSDWINENREQAGWLFDAVTGFLLGLGGATVVPGIITAVSGAIDGLGVSLGVLALGFDPVKIAIAAVIGVGYFLIRHWDEVKELAGKLGEKISKTWTNIKQWTEEKWNAAKEAIQTAWGSITGAVDEATQNVGQWISERFEAAKTAIVTAWSAVSTWTASTWTSITTTVEQKAEAVRNWIVDRFGEAEKSAETAWTNISSWTTETWNSISSTTQSLWNGISTNAATAFNSVQTTVTGAWNTAKTRLGEFISWVNGTFSGNWENAWNGIVSGFGRIFGGLGDLLKTPVNGVITLLNTMISKVESAINWVVNGINSALTLSVPAFGFYDFWGNWIGTSAWSWSPNLSGVSWGRIDYLAKGGILDAETLLGFSNAGPIVGGEAGREAVLPLDSNTGWMDEVAARINQQAEQQSMTSSANYYNDYGDHVNATDVSEIERALGTISRYLERIERKDTTIEVTTGQIVRAVERTNRRSGAPVIATGY